MCSILVYNIEVEHCVFYISIQYKGRALCVLY